MSTRQNFFTSGAFSGIILIILGVLGYFFGYFFLMISCIALIIYGIICLVLKKPVDGIISVLIGMAIIFLSWFFQKVINIVGLGCIIFGFLMLLFYSLKKKKK